MYEDADIDEFRNALLSKREDLMHIADTTAEAADTVSLDQTRVGRLSRMDALQQQAMAKESDRRRVLELKRIDTALSRIESGDYGLCLRCDTWISRARLQIDPAATLCVDCASKSNG